MEVLTFKWGDTILKVLSDTYNPPYLSSNNITEMQVIPSPTDKRPKTILQQTGTERKTSSMSLIIYSLSDYNAFLDDYANAVTRLFTGPEGVLMNMLISSLGQPSYITPSKITFSIELLEA